MSEDLRVFFRNERFIWDNDFDFGERFGDVHFFEGRGELIPAPHSRVMWETNFVPDLSSFGEMRPYAARGAGGNNINFVLADGTMHSHISEIPAGRYKKAHRHGPDFYVFAVTGHGYSLFWYEDQTAHPCQYCAELAKTNVPLEMDQFPVRT